MRNVFGLTIRKAAPRSLAGKFLVEHEDLLPNESKIADIVGTALEELRGGAFGQSLMNALNTGNAVQAVANLDWGKFGQTLSTMRLPLEQQLTISGKAEAASLGDVIGHMAFNVTDPRAVEWASQNAGEMVVTMSQSVKDDVRGVITSAFVNQTDPREIAGMIDRQVGLFPRWAQAVENRYQTSVSGFMAQGMSHTEASSRAQNLADAYRERLIDKRCQMIARTEVIRAANEGRATAWAQAAEAGLIDPATTTKEWIAESDACDECAEYDTEQVWLDDVFSSGDEMPPAHPNCRCSAVLVPDGEPTEKSEPAVTEPDTLPAMTSEDITPAPEEAPAETMVEVATPDDQPIEVPSQYVDESGEVDWNQIAEDQEAQRDRIIDELLDGQERLPMAEAEAVNWYQSEAGFEAMNEALRQGETGMDHLEALDGAIARGSMPEDTALHRGVAFESLDALHSFIDPMAVGSVVSDAGFMSTSIDPAVASMFANDGAAGLIMRIETPAGTPYHYLHDVEYEVLLARGTPLEVVSVKQNDALGTGPNASPMYEMIVRVASAI